MSARKRSREDMEAVQSTNEGSDGLLHRLRNTWTFANVYQFLQMFGQAVGITDDYDIEDFEEDCLKPGPTRLADVALALAKCTRSRNDRGTLEYLARKTFAEKQPNENHFGEKGSGEEKDFASFDIFTKLRVIHDLSRWVWLDPENKFKARALKIEENEEEWRINEFGWDSEERIYFVLDDNRLYRQTRAPPPAAPQAAKSKAKKTKAKPPPKPRAKGTRRSARGRVDTPETEDEAEDIESNEDVATISAEAESSPDNGLGGDKWECLCITLQDYQAFIESIKKSRDADEKTLRNRITEHVLPIIEGIEEERARKVAKRHKELQTLEKMATAKRSSRLAGKAEKEREEQEAREAEEKRAKYLAAAKKDAERQAQLDNDRKSRMQTREQRQREREYKRILQEDELKKLEEEQERMESGEVESKKSERQLKAELKKKQEALEQLEEDEWVFDCAACGVYGQNVDDGKHSIACERCNVWQHSACLGLTMAEAEKEDFRFICDDCKRKEEDAKKPKIAPLKFKAFSSPKPPSDSPALNGNAQPSGEAVIPRTDQQQKRKAGEIDGSNSKPPPMKKFKPHAPAQSSQPAASTHPNGASMHNAFMNGPTLSPQGQVQYPVNGNRPPGLVSPQRPTHNLSNYSPSNAMEFGPLLHGSNAQQPVINGSSPQKASGNLYTPTGQRDPFRNTFATQAPGSSQSRASPQQGEPLPTQNGNRMGPPLSTPSSSFNGNGSFQHAGPSTPAQHPYVPQKQPTAAPSPAPSMNLQASSPPMAPTLRPDAATAGMSPVKNSPPRPASRDFNTTPVVPPTQKLMPSPTQADKPVTGAESPIKSSAPPPRMSLG